MANSGRRYCYQLLCDITSMPHCLLLSLSQVQIGIRIQCECKQGMQKWEKCWCGCVAKAPQTTFVYAAKFWWTAEYYTFGLGTSKKNKFAMLDLRLTRQMTNKPHFARMGHSFGFVLVPHASFAFAYRCGTGFTKNFGEIVRTSKKNYGKFFQ